MTMLARLARTPLRAPLARRFATAELDPVHHAGVKSKFLEDREAVRHHAEQTTKLWRNISYLVCIPAIVGGYFWVMRVEGEHEAHQAHLREENGGHLPEKPHYEYLNIRRRAFPWGNNSLFFNPHTQRDMNVKE
ncbi:mitochondrial cytochrome c oxidase subunit VIa [Dacryopinax primogenitus]|uniref:Mitochondrial cytochrome c oxidase subunit VIa n=1 Tax=Dacryopinax primogenitus (strain DJM 731) TaxID=1858805 RepID=M5G227_DACPD|nr:mitochondrial cytochrome c oxidase subunit VIa [Dacryopinax primogenitus]EJT97817.1 mitochondrial cytochrome c oxidase subunit VIa [Dacryopinax primogenitus]